MENRLWWAIPLLAVIMFGIYAFKVMENKNGHTLSDLCGDIDIFDRNGHQMIMYNDYVSMLKDGWTISHKCEFKFNADIKTMGGRCDVVHRTFRYLEDNKTFDSYWERIQ